VIAPLGMLARTVARARARAGFADPLARVREAIAGHPIAARLLVASPAVGWLVMWNLQVAYTILHWGGPSMFADAGSDRVRAMHEPLAGWMAIAWCPGALTTIAVYAATRAAVRALLAPTLEGEVEARADADRIEFAAVAVTAETRAAVAAMAVLPVATIGA